MKDLKFIDLFCGIGGFHYATDLATREAGFEAKCVFASDIDVQAQEAYKSNFGLQPHGDITSIDAESIPNHDLLLAGFPCQAFSIIGERRGFNDIRGTLFFDIARILEAKRPSGFVLENVKQLRGHDSGRTIQIILRTLRDLDYDVDMRVLNALDFGLPQKRERVFIVGWKQSLRFDWDFPPSQAPSLRDVLEKRVDKFYYASEKIRASRQRKVLTAARQLSRYTIWHENKSGNVSVHPYSCALRAGASYNYLLVDGERRLTEREMLRLQGFPESFVMTHGYATMRRFAGNSLPIPVARAVISRLLVQNLVGSSGHKRTKASKRIQGRATLSAE